MFCLVYNLINILYQMAGHAFEVKFQDPKYFAPQQRDYTALLSVEHAVRWGVVLLGVE